MTLLEGKFHEAEHLLRREMSSCEQGGLGQEHPTTLTAAHCLGQVYFETNESDEAAPLLERTLALRSKVLGPTHGDTLASVAVLMQCWVAQGRATNEAVELFEERVMRAVEKVVVVVVKAKRDEELKTLGLLMATALIFVEGGHVDEVRGVEFHTFNQPDPTIPRDPTTSHPPPHHTTHNRIVLLII